MKILIKLLIYTSILMTSHYALAQSETYIIDDFENTQNWQAAASDGVSAVKSQIEGKNNKAIRLDYDFNKRSGYSFIRREISLEHPVDYEISFYIRGEGLKNSLEFKLSDKSGENVWWRPMRDFSPSKDWQLIKIKKRHISFAWGPNKDQSLKTTDFLEFVIAAGQGGKGHIEIDDLKITPIIPDNSPPPPPIINKNKNEIMVDLGRIREFGGLKINWNEKSAKIINYKIEASNNNIEWQEFGKIINSNQSENFFKTTEASARYIRIIPIDIKENLSDFKEIELLPLQIGESYNSFLEYIAKQNSRGDFPRGIYGEQEFWTLIGSDGGENSALISEDGGIEISRGGLRIEPIIHENGKIYNWANVKISHSLLNNYLPIPSVVWKTKNWQLKTSAIASPNPKNSKIFGEYELKNLSSRAIKLKLALNIIPMQVNAPKQFLAVNGGYSAINKIEISKNILTADGKKLYFTQTPNQFDATNFGQGYLTNRVKFFNNNVANDENGLSFGVMVFEITLKANETKKIGFGNQIIGQNEINETINFKFIEGQKNETVEYWENKLNITKITANGTGQDLADAIKTNLAYILMMKDGPILKPGSRSYNRSWIRDGAMIAEGLLRFGLYQEAKDYLSWFSPYQFDNGKIPCCVDFRGSDPVPENDSHGEYIYLVNLIYKYTHEKAILEKYWPNVKAAFDFINSQLALERSEKNETPERKHLYGLMPPTISHEGYSDKIAYSNWDNFWTLRGMYDASEIAMILGKNESDNMNQNRFEFETDLVKAIALAQKKYNIDYIPGAQDRGDFDATSTTIALLLELENKFPSPWFKATFDKYWNNFVKRRDIDKNWKDYTPYEWRVVSAFTRLNSPLRAEAASQYFINDIKPRQWNAFAEVVGREKRISRYLGDLPHGWVASDFIRSSIERFFYEKNGHDAVLGGGIDKSWLFGKGISVQELSTTKGKIAFKMLYKNKILNVETSGAKGFNFIIPRHLINNNFIIFNGKKIKTNGGDFIQNPPIKMN